MRVRQTVAAVALGVVVLVGAVGCGTDPATPIVTFRGPEEHREVLTTTIGTTSRDRVVTTKYWVLRWSIAGTVEERRWPVEDPPAAGTDPLGGLVAEVAARGSLDPCYLWAEIGKPLPQQCR